MSVGVDGWRLAVIERGHRPFCVFGWAVTFKSGKNAESGGSFAFESGKNAESEVIFVPNEKVAPQFADANEEATY